MKKFFIRKTLTFVIINSMLSLMVVHSFLRVLNVFGVRNEIGPSVVMFFVYLILHSYITCKVIPAFNSRKYFVCLMGLFSFFWLTGRFLLVSSLQFAFFGTMLVTVLVHTAVICMMYLIRELGRDIKLIQQNVSADETQRMKKAIYSLLSLFVVLLVVGVSTGNFLPEYIVTLLYNIFIQQPIMYWFIAFGLGGIILFVTRIISRYCNS